MPRTQVALQGTWVSSLSSHFLIAPEVMCRQNHGVAVDYFAVGVIAFECMFGRVIPKIIYIVVATLCWEVSQGNQGPHSLKTDLD